MPKVMEIIEKETKGKSYHTYKYSYDSIGLPSIDYDDDPNKVMKWKDSGETDSPKGAVDLKHLADQLQQLGETPLLKYFLDGSRHVFKVDDIAYNKQVFPVVAGQIGVGCCRRENKRMQKERFYRELVLALPDKANADGWDDKGDMRSFAVELICDDLINHLSIIFPEVFWKDYYPTLFNFIKIGKYAILEEIEDPIFQDEAVLDAIKAYRKKYKDKEYFTNPRFDKVGITTLFTFYWDITIDTINFAKQLCKKPEDVMIGGIMSSLLPTEVYEATGIEPFVGLLNHPGDIDEGNNLVIDELPLDYSILEEIDYVYPANNAYFAYMTRGCVNKCKFCAVPKLEPQYCDYINLRQRIQHTDERFGARKDLLLLDNNVLASKYYNQIINEIRDCGFGVGATYTPPNEYEIMINNLKDSYNDRAYIRKAISIYREIMAKLKDSAEKTELYLALETAHCLYYYTASKEDILGLDEYVRPLYEKTHKPSKRKRIVDFNQGIDSRLITEANIPALQTVTGITLLQVQHTVSLLIRIAQNSLPPLRLMKMEIQMLQR